MPNICRTGTTPKSAVWALVLGVPLLLPGCSPPEPNPLDSMPHADVQVKDQTIRAWIADEPEERESGLMGVTADQMAPLPNGTERGMIFVFAAEQSKRHGFWMKNTLISLDIAFIAGDGTIVTILTMAPQDTRHYYSRAAYRFALEVRGGLFSRLDVRSGDKVRIPNSLLKAAD